jgi:hypothetical protein
MTRVSFCDREQLTLIPGAGVMPLTSLTDALSRFFGESFIQFCLQAMVFVEVQCREHGQAGVIDRVGCVGNGTQLRIVVFSELENVVRIAAAGRTASLLANWRTHC